MRGAIATERTLETVAQSYLQKGYQAKVIRLAYYVAQVKRVHQEQEASDTAWAQLKSSLRKFQYSSPTKTT